MTLTGLRSYSYYICTFLQSFVHGGFLCISIYSVSFYFFIFSLSTDPSKPNRTPPPFSTSVTAASTPTTQSLNISSRSFTTSSSFPKTTIQPSAASTVHKDCWHWNSTSTSPWILQHRCFPHCSVKSKRKFNDVTQGFMHHANHKTHSLTTRK